MKSIAQIAEAGRGSAWKFLNQPVARRLNKVVGLQERGI